MAQLGALCISNLCATKPIEITDEKGNILLELQDNFILGKKSFSIYASKFNNFLTIFFKNVNFRDDVNQEDKSDINFHFPIWDGLDIRSLPYFEQIKRLVEKIENSKKLSLRIFINGNEVYSATALLHKDFKDRAFLSCLNLSDNLGVRSAELRKLI